MIINEHGKHMTDNIRLGRSKHYYEERCFCNDEDDCELCNKTGWQPFVVSQSLYVRFLKWMVKGINYV
jgi:hypothetical protein